MNFRTLWRLTGLAITLLAGIYFIGYANQNLRSLPPLDWDTGSWFVLTATILLWVGDIYLGAVIWRGLLADLDYRLPWTICLNIYGLAQFGKYLPGNVGHHVGRIVLARRVGVPATATMQTMLIEMAWVIGVGSGMALLGFAHFGDRDTWVSSSTLVLVLIAAMLIPWVGLWFVNTFLSGWVVRITGGSRIAPPRLGTMAWASLLYLLTFMSVALLLDLHARHLFGARESHLFMLSGIFAWSWIAGYITPGAPAGLGVREAVLVSALTPVYGAGTAIGLSLSLRAVTTLGDGLAFLIALVGQRRKSLV